MEHESAIDSITKHSQPKESNHKDVKRINSNRSKTMEFLLRYKVLRFMKSIAFHENLC